METRFIEAVHPNGDGNYGKFAVCRFTPEEWARRSAVEHTRLLCGRGWTSGHLLVLDLQTGEGAVFRTGGSASYDLNDKHRIWVCPLFEPFLVWLYTQDLTDLQSLPALVELPNAPFALYGYRRSGNPEERGQTT